MPVKKDETENSDVDNTDTTKESKQNSKICDNKVYSDIYLCHATTK